MKKIASGCSARKRRYDLRAAASKNRVAKIGSVENAQGN
jgi:hypothetical protein